MARILISEILNDEDIVLGVTPAGQSDDEPLSPTEAGQVFTGWAEKISAILDLIAASTALGPIGGQPGIIETVRYRPGTAFIMMWMDKSQRDLIEAVKEVFEKFYISAQRADDIEHEGLITDRILTEIKTAEFCFADLSGSRPNVYYEVGFAHARPRRVILFRKAGTGLHFDLAGYNCPEYEDLHDLKEKLTHRLRALTKIAVDAKQLAEAFRPAKLSELQIDGSYIVFNGAPPKDFETFGLSRLPQDVFCKTNHRPYDKLVCAVLSVAKQHYPALEVSSDALFEGLVIWPDAARWASRVLARNVPNTMERQTHNQRLADRAAAAD
jgi:hypothetical protein